MAMKISSLQQKLNKSILITKQKLICLKTQIKKKNCYYY